jgi:hypothetical protein
MVRLDALYIPFLSLTSAAQADVKAAPKAAAAAARASMCPPGRPVQQALAGAGRRHPPRDGGLVPG